MADHHVVTLSRAYYQHLSNGGITYQIQRKDSQLEKLKSPLHSLTLQIALSNYGMKSQFEVPVFATTAKAFEDLAQYIRAHAKEINFDPRYLSETGIPLTVYLESGKSESDFNKKDVLDNPPQHTLEVLMQQHRIAVFPEHESQMWHAEVFDNDSATPTRKAMANNPLHAAQKALEQPIPEFGDALDKHNVRDSGR